MFTDSNQRYKYGFIVDETNLRRLVDTINSQLMKVVESEDEINFLFEVKFKNGSVSIFESVDEILELENHGSSSIVSLKLSSYIREDSSDEGNQPSQNYLSPVTYIVLTFGDPKFTNSNPIELSVRGESRDWVFVTSSLLEERVKNTKRRQLPLLFKSERDQLSSHIKLDWVIYFIVTIISALLIFLWFVQQEINNFWESFPEFADFPMDVEDFIEEEIIISQELKYAVNQDGLSDPIEAIILAQELQEKRNEQYDEAYKQYDEARKSWLEEAPVDIINVTDMKTLWYMFPVALLPALFLYIFLAFIDKYYPVYNFCWGDYLDEFNKTERIRNFVLSGIILGLGLSILGGVIANQFSR